MQLYLAASPEDFSGIAMPAGLELAHAAYRIGPDSTLLSLQLPAGLQGGLLRLGDRGTPVVEQPEALASAILRECIRRSFSGVLLDMEETPRQDLLSAAAMLGQRLHQCGRRMFVPAVLQEQLPQATPLFCTAISGGTLRQYLTERIRQHRGSFALDVQRLQMDFPLPCPGGQGSPLTAEELRHLQQRFSAPVFFSTELFSKYFTYMQDGQGHLVLFDDRETLQQKLQLAAALNCSAAFFMWPEVRDLADRTKYAPA